MRNVQSRGARGLELRTAGVVQDSMSARPLFVGWAAGVEPEIIWELVFYFRLSTEAK